MKIHIELKKKRYILYAAIIALLGVVGANISILHTNADKITKHIEYKSFLTQLIAVFRVSITNKEGNGIFYQLMAAGLFILFLIVFSYKYKYTVREVISAAILSILYGFCMWIGTVFSHRESWDYFLRNKYVMLLNAFYMLGNAIILFGILLLLCRVILRISETDNQTEHSLKRVFLTCVLVLFVLWLPYYISMWPATIHGDFLMQVLQLFHYPTMLQHQLTSDGVNVLYSNDHPFLHTQLVGLFIKFGIKINNKALGYGMYTFLQMTAYIGGISAIITTLYKFGANHRILKAALGAYALFPVFPLYAIMVGGDSFFALFFLWFMVGILWIFKTQGEVLKNIKFDIFFAVIVFLMSASKNQGIYIALVTLVFCVICLKKYRIKILVTMFVPIFIFQFAYTGLLFKAARVSTVGKQEALSVCFQQTACRNTWCPPPCWCSATPRSSSRSGKSPAAAPWSTSSTKTPTAAWSRPSWRLCWPTTPEPGPTVRGWTPSASASTTPISPARCPAPWPSTSSPFCRKNARPRFWLETGGGIAFSSLLR